MNVLYSEILPPNSASFVDLRLAKVFRVRGDHKTEGCDFFATTIALVALHERARPPGLLGSVVGGTR